MRRPVDAEMPELVETDADRSVAPTKGRVQIHAQARDGRLFDRARGASRKRFQALLRIRRCAAQEFAFGPMQFQLKDQLMATHPRISRKQCRAGDEVLECQ